MEPDGRNGADRSATAGERGRDARADGRVRAEVERLCRERDAAILAHYYVDPSVQELADHVGDSFALSRLAASLDCGTLVFAGVRFMAESAKLLSPDKRVLMPAARADCPMAHMVDRSQIARAREQWGDDLAVACYVNSTVEAKALSDVCVTSSNAVRIVRRLPQRNVLFIPDRHLGRYVQERVPEKNVILADGFCPTHQAITPAMLDAVLEAHPGALVLAHPECDEGVVARADVVGSTAELVEAAAGATAQELVVLTVEGVSYEMERRLRGTGRRIVFPEPVPACADMSLVTVEGVLSCLEEGGPEVPPIDPALAAGARSALDRMLELGR